MKKIGRKVIEEVVRKVLKESKTGDLQHRISRLQKFAWEGSWPEIYKIVFVWVRTGAISQEEYEKIMNWMMKNN